MLGGQTVPIRIFLSNSESKRLSKFDSEAVPHTKEQKLKCCLSIDSHHMWCADGCIATNWLRTIQVWISRTKISSIDSQHCFFNSFISKQAIPCKTTFVNRIKSKWRMLMIPKLTNVMNRVNGIAEKQICPGLK